MMSFCVNQRKSNSAVTLALPRSGQVKNYTSRTLSRAIAQLGFKVRVRLGLGFRVQG